MEPSDSGGQRKESRGIKDWFRVMAGAKRVWNITTALAVRLMLFLHVALTTWRVVEMRRDDTFWLLLFGAVLMVLEASYTIYRRDGVEPKWICPCFLAYLAAALPGIWLLEISRTENFGNINTTVLEDINIGGVHIPIRLEQDTWVLIVEESLLYLMIIARWLLPRGKVSREQLSELLFALIGIASDIMELFSLFDEKVIRNNYIMTYALLGVWSWSVLQFCLVVTAAERSNRSKNLGKTRRPRVLVELVAVLVSLLMQDGPFLVLRLVTMLRYTLVNYSLVFFTAKNALVILLLLYRLMVMCSMSSCWRNPKDEEAIHGAEMEIVVPPSAQPRPEASRVDGGSAALRRRTRPQSADTESLQSRSTESSVEEAIEAMGNALGGEEAGRPGSGRAASLRVGGLGGRAGGSDSQLAQAQQSRSRDAATDGASTPPHDSLLSSARSAPLLVIPSLGPAPDEASRDRSNGKPTVSKLVTTVNVKL